MSLGLPTLMTACPGCHARSGLGTQWCCCVLGRGGWSFTVSCWQSLLCWKPAQSAQSCGPCYTKICQENEKWRRKREGVCPLSIQESFWRGPSTFSFPSSLISCVEKGNVDSSVVWERRRNAAACVHVIGPRLWDRPDLQWVIMNPASACKPHLPNNNNNSNNNNNHNNNNKVQTKTAAPLQHILFLCLYKGVENNQPTSTFTSRGSAFTSASTSGTGTSSSRCCSSRRRRRRRRRRRTRSSSSSSSSGRGSISSSSRSSSSLVMLVVVVVVEVGVGVVAAAVVGVVVVVVTGQLSLCKTST